MQKESPPQVQSVTIAAGTTPCFLSSGTAPFLKQVTTPTIEDSASAGSGPDVLTPVQMRDELAAFEQCLRTSNNAAGSIMKIVPRERDKSPKCPSVKKKLRPKTVTSTKRYATSGTQCLED